MTSDPGKVSHMLDRLLPLVSPRDSVVLIHIVEETVEDVIAGETEDMEQVLLNNSQPDIFIRAELSSKCATALEKRLFDARLAGLFAPPAPESLLWLP